MASTILWAVRYISVRIRMPTTLRNYRRRQLSRNGHYAETGFGSADLRELIAARTNCCPAPTLGRGICGSDYGQENHLLRAIVSESANDVLSRVLRHVKKAPPERPNCSQRNEQH